MHADIVRLGNWKLLIDKLQATNIPSSNTVTRCLFYSFITLIIFMILMK